MVVAILTLGESLASQCLSCLQFGLTQNSVLTNNIKFGLLHEDDALTQSKSSTKFNSPGEYI